MPADIEQTLRSGSLVDNAILIPSLSLTSLTKPLVNLSDLIVFKARDLSD